MSEALEKVAGIRSLPIFPLPLVMLPNELVPLHIFEEKYREMLVDISKSGGFFGVSFFEPQESFGAKPEPGSVGCVAEIRESETLEDGRSNILTLGVVRYHLIEYLESEKPYLLADVEFFEDETEPDEVISPLADEVFALFERMAKAAYKMAGSRGRLPEIARTDPEALSFLITAAFSYENEKKYRLLEMRSTIERLTDLKDVLNHAVRQVEETAEIHEVSRKNGHSKKKIDL